MTNCPNGASDFNQVLLHLFGNSSPELRRNVFYGVCIPIRFLLYSLVFYYRDFYYMPIIVGLFAFITAARLLSSIFNPGTQWWSKRWQFAISIILLLVCVGVYLQRIDNRAMGIVLFVSLTVGIIESLMISFC